MSKGIFATAALAIIAVAIYAAPLHSEDAPKTMTEHSERMCNSLKDLEKAFRKDGQVWGAIGVHVGVDFCDKQQEYIKSLESQVAQTNSVQLDPEIEKIKQHTQELEAQIKATEEETWYSTKFTGTRPTTLKASIEAEKKVLGADNPFWVGHGGGNKVCSALKAVKLSCDYNTRITLSIFLTINDKGLFPASGKTNPYVTERKADDWYPDDGFIGQPKQNEMLAQAVTRNAELFNDGDISVDAVKNFWK